MARIVLYEHVQRGGKALPLTGDDWNLTNNSLSLFRSWNDKVSSVDVQSGTWRLYEHIDREGDFLTLGPGFYNLTGYYHDGESWNDEVSGVDLLHA